MKRHIPMLRLLAAVIVGLTASAITIAPAQAKDTATVSILHAVPDATVDVYANGDSLLTDFKPGTLTSPQRLPAGVYDLKVVMAGDGADGKAVAELKDAKIPSAANVTVVAHLDAKGNPELSAYANDVSMVPAGKARLIVRHDAAAPAVDVRADKKPVFTDLTNPKEASGEVPAGTISADVVLAGTNRVAIGPADLNLKEGTTTIVYAWGSAQDDNLDLAVQMISGMNGAPDGVPGGTGGQAAASAATPGWAIGAFTVGIVGLAVLIVRTRFVRSSIRK